MAMAGDPAPAGQEKIRAGGCGGCTLCCKVMGVPSLDKPANQWCAHCRAGIGCGVYDNRPAECRTFICGYLSMPALADEWKPVVSRLVINTQSAEGTMIVYVDPARPEAWRRQPYYGALQAWARQALPSHGRVIVRLAERNIVILPDHAVDLGALATDEVIVVLSMAGRGGEPGYQVYAAKSDTWAKVGLEVQQGHQIAAITEGFRSGRRLD
jgi:hypothetical protein